MKPVVERLRSGLMVALAPEKNKDVVSYQMWVGVGSADELSGEEGLAHVFEHMLFKGTQKRAVGEITRDVERVGGQINAWTSPDETVFYITLAARYWRGGIDILADAIKNPALDREELLSELQVIREEIRMGEDSPDRSITRALFKSLFKKHPYGRPVIGYDRTVKGFTRKDVVGFYNKWYVPKNMILSVAGDFDPKKMMRKIDALLGEPWQGRRKRVPVREARIAEPGQKKARVSFLTKPVSEAHIAVGYPIPGLTHEDIPALDLLAAVLGQGASSRLETGLKREGRLVNSIRAMAYTPSDAGLFGVFATAPPKQLDGAIRGILVELDRLTKAPVSSDELEKARTLLESDNVYSEETVDGVARKHGFYAMHAGDVEFEEKYLAVLSSLSPGDLMRAARRYLLPSGVNLAAVLPEPTLLKEDEKLFFMKGRGEKRQIDRKKLTQAFFAATRVLTKPIAPKRGRDRAGETIVHEMSTGDVLIVRTTPTSKLVAARAAFWGGSRLEKPAEAGVFGLLANSLTRGTGGLSATDVARQMDSLACSIEGFSGRNTMGISGEFLLRNFEEGFSLMSRCLREPALATEEVTRERELLLEQISASEHNPGYAAFKLLAKTLFGGHPYSRPVWGSAETLSSLGAEQLRSCLQKTTARGGMIMAVEGGADPDTVIDLVEREFLTTGKKVKLPASPRTWKGPRTVRRFTKFMPNEQSHVVLGFRGTTITSEDRFALEVMTEILGGHGGRLFDTVREKKGLAYAVTATAMSGVEPGYIALYAGTSPGKEPSVIEGMLEEVARIRESRVPAEELVRVKRHLVGARAIARQRASTRAANTALDYLYGNGPDEGAHFAERIDPISPDDIAAVAQKYLDSQKHVVVCVGPSFPKE